MWWNGRYDRWHMKSPDKTGAQARPRLDQALVDRGLVESLSRAQAMVMAGKVYSGERRLEKSGMRIKEDMAINVRGEPHPWVSRGGLKLAHALSCFAIDAKGWVALDVGSSTGGFTDVLLAEGASRVYAVDVGRGQLAWKLRKDDRVIVLEGMNARALSTDEIPEPPDAVVCDASFIGLHVVLPAALTLARPGAHLVALIKPQFEVGRGQVGEGGIVRDPALHEEVTNRIRTWLEKEMGWKIIGIVESPVLGAEGNKEFLIAAQKPEEDAS
jgi:23S rRNA (cytidine1920-2'-O)/16S rRNA (cytidine1409-2'-O)-methyltransferase